MGAEPPAQVAPVTIRAYRPSSPQRTLGMNESADAAAGFELNRARLFGLPTGCPGLEPKPRTWCHRHAHQGRARTPHSTGWQSHSACRRARISRNRSTPEARTLRTGSWRGGDLCVAGLAVGLDDRPARVAVRIVVAPEAAGGGDVAAVVRIGTPGHFHVGKHVAPIQGLQRRHGARDGVLVDLSAAGPVEATELTIDRFSGLAGVRRLHEPDALATRVRKLPADPACRDRVIHGPFR